MRRKVCSEYDPCSHWTLVFRAIRPSPSVASRPPHEHHPPSHSPRRAQPPLHSAVRGARGNQHTGQREHSLSHSNQPAVSRAAKRYQYQPYQVCSTGSHRSTVACETCVASPRGHPGSGWAHRRTQHVCTARSQSLHVTQSSCLTAAGDGSTISIQPPRMAATFHAQRQHSAWDHSL